MERDILADLDHAFIVQLHYGESVILFLCDILSSLPQFACH